MTCLLIFVGDQRVTLCRADISQDDVHFESAGNQFVYDGGGSSRPSSRSRFALPIVV